MAEASKRADMPPARIDLVVLSIVDGHLCVLLGKRTQAPYAKRLALPGGELLVDQDKTLDSAVQRVAQTALGGPVPFVRQLCTVGAKARDSKQAWSLSVVYRVLLPLEAVAAWSGMPTKDLQWVVAHEAAADDRLAFDHAELIARALAVTAHETAALHLPEGFVPEQFTLSELQVICEVLGGQRLDKSSFRRKLAERGLVVPVRGAMRSGEANRPAQIYALNDA